MSEELELLLDLERRSKREPVNRHDYQCDMDELLERLENLEKRLSCLEKKLGIGIDEVLAMLEEAE